MTSTSPPKCKEENEPCPHCKKEQRFCAMYKYSFQLNRPISITFRGALENYNNIVCVINFCSNGHIWFDYDFSSRPTITLDLKLSSTSSDEGMGIERIPCVGGITINTQSILPNDK
jgi:hypothetical protein